MLAANTAMQSHAADLDWRCATQQQAEEGCRKEDVQEECSTRDAVPGDREYFEVYVMKASWSRPGHAHCWSGPAPGPYPPEKFVASIFAPTQAYLLLAAATVGESSFTVDPLPCSLAFSVWPVVHSPCPLPCHLQVTPCPKRCVHDWSLCPFAHCGEKARRRDPRVHTGIACVSMKQVRCVHARGSSITLPSV